MGKKGNPLDFIDNAGRELGNGIANVGNTVGKPFQDVGRELQSGVDLLTGEKRKKAEKKAKKRADEAKKQLAKKEAAAKEKYQTDVKNANAGRFGTLLGGTTGGEGNLFRKRLLGE